jgi:hypothetical protein
MGTHLAPAAKKPEGGKSRTGPGKVSNGVVGKGGAGEPSTQVRRCCAHHAMACGTKGAAVYIAAFRGASGLRCRVLELRVRACL